MKKPLLHSFLVSMALFAPFLAAPAPAQSDTTAARGLLERLLPQHAKHFVLEIIPRDPAGDVFEIESRNGRIALRGNNGVSIASALNWYLKHYCGCHHSFTGGSQLQLPRPLPQVAPKVRQVSSARYRYFLNYCTFGYSLPWYDWAQWERLIDWMALNGINLPLSVTGQEAVWQVVGRRMGWSERDMQAFLAGPPYLPFGWMGCLDGHGGPLPQSWIDRHIELQKKILERQRALGMTPVLQGFTGHVPAALASHAPAAKLQKIKWIEWETCLLDPLDPLFARIAAVFMEEQTKLFGTDHFYAADTFIEMIPPNGDTDYLSGIGRAIFDGMKATDPQAVWVLQSWPFFFAQHFWTQPRIEAVLGAIPDERILLLDLFCEKTPLWSRTKAFCGKPWLWCNIQNFGDRVWLGGPLDLISRDVFAVRRDPSAGRLSGLGFVNEGLDNNPVVFDLLFELAWRDKPVLLDGWLRDFARRSYGKSNPEAEQAWRILHETVFQSAFDNQATCTVAPSLAASPATPYSNQRLAVAWKQMLAAADDLRGADPFRFDLVNLTRQVLGNHSAQFQREALEAFHQKDRKGLNQASTKMLDLIRDLDGLLATRREFLLGNWLEDARRWGTTRAERDRLEWNARRVLTLWGNGTALRDYACRQWSGLLSGFYLKRWELFYRRLDEALAAGKPFDEKVFAAEMFELEKNWSGLHERYPREPRGDSISASRRLWEKYGGALDFRPDCPSLTTGKPASCSAVEEQAGIDKLAGQPVDLAPWAYAWRADRTVQEKPEACFIPRRLDRLDKVYRTAYAALPPEQLKSIHYQQLDLLNPLPPKPKGRLLTGLLWTGGLVDYRVELHWPTGVEAVPSPEAIEVRVYPTAWGWFGWTVDTVLGKPEVSADRRTWTYRPEAGAKMDWAYSQRVDAATEMVAVFSGDGTTANDVKPAVPSIRVTGPNLGNWKRMDVEIEWGFQASPKMTKFAGRLESQVALVGPVSPLADDKGTTVTGAHTWRSRIAGDTRHGIVVPLVYAPDSRPGLDSRITIWTKTTGITIRLRDLENGPILIPQPGVFVAKAGSGTSAKGFAAALAAKNLKSVRQQVREHREAASWDEVLREVRLWRCPAGTAVPPFPPTPEPAMQVQLPDQRWTDMWRTATDQLRGRHMWGNLAFEVAAVAHAMELVGLHAEAAKIYDYFLASPGVKSDGDYADPKGSLEWAKAMRHDMGYNHEGTHCSTGRLLFSMAERYFLTGDKEWIQQNRSRLQAAVDWIIRERKAYLQNIPNRKDLHVVGLMPPCMVGDYALPACDWHWYYFDNVFALQGLSRFADMMMEFDPPAGRKYRAEAEAFRADIRRAVERDVALAPVRLARDGTYRSYIPCAAYARGLMNTELGAPQYDGGRPMDLMLGALPLASPASVLEANDARMVDTLDVLEESGASANGVRELEEARKKMGLPTADAWFWMTYIKLPKCSFNASIYLLQDDVPNFLRFWMNESVSMVGANGKLWEHWRPDQYTTCDDPDNGTSGWFLENFRNLLVMEDGQNLWLARATPRTWLESGKKISVKNAPTYFGTVDYEIVSDVDHGKITATVRMPARHSAKAVWLRLRHPKSAPIQSVSLNGKDWKDFDPAKEVVKLHDRKDTVVVEINY